MKLGIDFGTTNSAVAIMGSDGRPTIVQLVPGEDTQRTVIFSALRGGELVYGNAALRRYMDEDFHGRFLRSLKAFLPQSVPSTFVGGRRYEFTELVALYLRFLVRSTERLIGEDIEHITIGRPVQFHADPGKEARAFGRLKEAAASAGLRSFDFRFEPVAAARRYELNLSQDRTILVGDFGGGTSDFAVLRVGPSHIGGDRSKDVLGVSGVAKAGDALDSLFMEAFLLDDFGRGAMIRRLDQSGNDVWNPAVLRKILKLYDIYRLKDRALATFLSQSEARMDDTTKIQRLRRLIYEDLGYPMAWEIEAAKRALSEGSETTFEFNEFFDPALNITHQVRLEDYAIAATVLTNLYRDAVQLVLDRSGVTAEEIDEVFLTGGTSQLPFIRTVFADLFGVDKLRDANAFTSVCEGLVLP